MHALTAGVAAVAAVAVVGGTGSSAVAKPAGVGKSREARSALTRAGLDRGARRGRVRPVRSRGRRSSARVRGAGVAAQQRTSGPGLPPALPGLPLSEPGQAEPAASESATGPVGLPTTGVLLDPLSAGEPEQQLEIQQPNASLLPFFQDATGWFGQGFVNSDGSVRASVTVGADRVLVLSDVSDRVFIYDARTLAAATPASFPTGFTSSLNISFYRGGIYVLGDVPDPLAGNGQRVSKVKVFNFDGQLQDEFFLRPPHRPVGAIFSGLDVAWGEIWVSTPSQHTGAGDVVGQEVAVFDATNGAFKGAGRQPLADRDRDEPNRYWWDFALSPELGGGISDRRFFGRGASPLVGFGTDNATGCTGRVVFGCVANNQRGIDAVWGMRWFLELNSPVVNNYDRQVTEYSIDKRKAVAQPALGLTLNYPGYYLAFKRSWAPKQAQQNSALTLTDVVYSHRKARIDWEGPLTKPDWVRGTQSLTYVVSDADIFVIGDRGERWYEPARGFQKIELWIDGQLKGTSLAESGQFDIDTTQYANRPEGVQPPHTLELRAYLEGGRVVSSTNPDLRIDNLAPTGTITPPGPYARGTVPLVGSISDGHAGPHEWRVQVASQGGGWTELCRTSETDLAGVATCKWNTAAGGYPDGVYTLRAQVVDRSSGGGNVGYTSEVTTTVDNTAPVVDHPAPALGSDYEEEVTHDDVDVLLRHADATSGIEQTVLEYNTAPDGTDSGTWQPITRPPITQEGEVDRPWDTGEIPDGLYQIRALSVDRAGNRSDTRWQAVLSAKRKRRRCPTNGNIRRCYGGAAFNIGGLGVHGRIRPPGFDPGGSSWSWFAFGYGAASSVQVGIDDGKCRESRWFVMGEWTKTNGEFAQNCMFAAGDRNRFYAIYQPDKGGVRVAVEDNDGRNRVRSIGGRESFWIQRRGREVHIFGETPRYGRRIGGTASAIKWRPRSNTGWVDLPEQYFSLDTPGYHHRWIGDSICVWHLEGDKC